MQEQLISFETAKLAKEKGFNEVCSYLYEDSKDIIYTTHINSGLNKHFDWYSAPTQTLLQKWLREVHKHLVIITPADNWKSWVIVVYGEDIMSPFYKSFESFIDNSSYEEALELGLQEALKLIEL